MTKATARVLAESYAMASNRELEAVMERTHSESTQLAVTLAMRGSSALTWDSHVADIRDALLGRYNAAERALAA